MSSAGNITKITVIGGEGIGSEVKAQSHRVQTWFAGQRGMPIVLRDADYGVLPCLRTGEVVPLETCAAIDEADALAGKDAYQAT